MLLGWMALVNGSLSGAQMPTTNLASIALPAPTNFVFLPPGTFRMGSPANEPDRSPKEGAPTSVTIGRGFGLGKYPVTQGEYLAVMGTNPSYFAGDLSRPVEGVSWGDATNYCALLTRRERVAGRIATNAAYRLPTEAEREYACRAGTTNTFSFGDDPGYGRLADYAWYAANSGGMTHPVGLKLPNPWGLYDMHGNVAEWCQDGVDSAVSDAGRSPGRRPREPLRKFRGGFWDSPASYCRSAARGQSVARSRSAYVGFRVVLVTDP